MAGVERGVVTPELLTALASLGTFVVIAITAIAAIIQLRHIRAGNQLSGVMQYSTIWNTDALQSANKFVENELPAKLRDHDYRKGLFAKNPDRREHPELRPGDWCEQAGSYIKAGLIDKNQFLDLSGGYIETMWQALREVVAIRRVAAGKDMYVNFEYLAVLAQEDRQQTQRHYPQGFPRLLSDEECRVLAGPPPKD